MNTFEVNYGLVLTQTRKLFFLIIGVYLGLYGLYESILQTLAGNYNFNFYLAIIALILGLIMTLSLVLHKPKPMAKINQESIFINMPEIKSVYSSEWIAIKEVGIGINFLKFSETDGKDYTVDISDLKYSDLKNLKSAIIELCEAKNIPYRND